MEAAIDNADISGYNLGHHSWLDHLCWFKTSLINHITGSRSTVQQVTMLFINRQYRQYLYDRPDHIMLLSLMCSQFLTVTSQLVI